jgi:hypothetical protein
MNSQLEEFAPQVGAKTGGRLEPPLTVFTFLMPFDMAYARPGTSNPSAITL